jgi:hypothetical protein
MIILTLFLTLMKHRAPSLNSFICAAISIVLFLLIPLSFLLLALGINPLFVEFAYGQEAGDNTIKSNISVANFSPVLLQEQQQEQHQLEQLDSDAIPMTDIERSERLFSLESNFPSPQSATTIQPSLLPPEALIPSAPDAIPPDTVLPLVTDINTRSTIQSGGATDSSSVLSLTFEGLDETGNAVAGFQCRLDGLPSYYCTPPITIDNEQIMATGISYIQPSSNIHTFQVSAVDAAGNIDPSPASFEWNLLNSIEKEPLSSDTTPPDTQIVSAADSNNAAAVLNGSYASIPLSSSTSLVTSQHATSGSAANAIAFSFAGTDNSNVVTGYQCAAYSSSSLTEQIVFAPCASPIILNIPVEQSITSTETRNGIDATYIFQVRAIDAAGNVDTSPATFQWSNTLATGIEEEPPKMRIDQDTLFQ